MPVRRDRQLKVMISDEEAAMLRALADQDGVSIADVVRGLVRNEMLRRKASTSGSPSIETL